MSQKEMVLNHLKKHRNGLTALEALGMYGIFRLATRVFELKYDDKHNIETVLKKDLNGKMYARYVLKEGKHETPPASYAPRIFRGTTPNYTQARHSAAH